VFFSPWAGLGLSALGVSVFVSSLFCVGCFFPVMSAPCHNLGYLFWWVFWCFWLFFLFWCSILHLWFFLCCLCWVWGLVVVFFFLLVCGFVLFLSLFLCNGGFVVGFYSFLFLVFCLFFSVLFSSGVSLCVFFFRFSFGFFSFFFFFGFSPPFFFFFFFFFWFFFLFFFSPPFSFPFPLLFWCVLLLPQSCLVSFSSSPCLCLSSFFLSFICCLFIQLVRLLSFCLLCLVFFFCVLGGFCCVLWFVCFYWWGGGVDFTGCLCIVVGWWWEAGYTRVLSWSLLSSFLFFFSGGVAPIYAFVLSFLGLLVGLPLCGCFLTFSLLGGRRLFLLFFFFSFSSFWGVSFP